MGLMATGNRTLKLSILADVDDLKKKLGEADKAVEDNSNKISDFGKKAGAAFAIAAAAAGAYAGKLAIDGVKAAIEDEQAQNRLAESLKATTGATDAQIKAVEDMITKMSLATGVSDDVLRPAMQRLATSTKDTKESQELLALALDISKGSGKDLETVANALAKAHDGQDGALVRLGIGLTNTEAKTKTFKEEQKLLSDLYGGAAATNAETFQGKMDRLKISFEEAQESLGFLLLPYVEKFTEYLLEKGIPTLEGFIAGLTGDEGLSNALQENQRDAESWGKAIGTVADIVGKFITFIREAIGLVISLANEFIKVINLIPGANIGSIPNIAPSANIAGVPEFATRSNTRENRTTVNNITVQSVDPEGSARAVAKVLNQSASRSVPQLYNNGIKGN
jgi:hypothetical protein